MRINRLNVPRPAMGVMGSRWRVVPQPNAAFSFLPFAIQTDGATFRADPAWDISAQIPYTGGDYYVSKAGNDSTGDGLSWATAWKTIPKAHTVLGATPNCRIFIGAGVWGQADGSFAYHGGPTADRSYVGVGDVYFDSYYPAVTYALVSGRTYTFSGSTAYAIDNVFDYDHLDAEEFPSAYVAKASVDDVEATAGSYFYDSANALIYVHTIDEVTPSANVRSQGPTVTTVFSTVRTAGVKVYLENAKICNMT